MSLRPVNKTFLSRSTGLPSVQPVSAPVNGIAVTTLKPTFIPAKKALPCDLYTLTAEAQRNELQKIPTVVLRDVDAIKEFADEMSVELPNVPRETPIENE